VSTIDEEQHAHGDALQKLPVSFFDDGLAVVEGFRPS
jgi:hypothetical protein